MCATRLMFFTQSHTEKLQTSSPLQGVEGEDTGLGAAPGLRHDKTQGVAAKHERQLTESLPGVEFAPWAVKAFTKAKRESDSKYFVMNTLCWPEDNVKRYVPELLGLFEWIKERLDTFISG